MPLAKAGLDVAGVGAILPIAVSVCDKRLPTVGAGAAVKSGFPAMHQLGVSRPPRTAASVGAEAPPPSSFRLDDGFSATLAGQPQLDLLPDVHGHFIPQPLETLPLAVVADNIAGQAGDRGDGLIADTAHAEISDLLFLHLSHLPRPFPAAIFRRETSPFLPRKVNFFAERGAP